MPAKISSPAEVPALHSSSSSSSPPSRLDPWRSAGHPAPHCAFDPVRLAEQFRDHPSLDCGVAVIRVQHRRRRPLGLGWARSSDRGSCCLPCPHHDFEIGRWLVIAWPGPASVSRAVREKGKNISRPWIRETTNRYNDNDCVSKRVHELAFGIVICFAGAKTVVKECKLQASSTFWALKFRIQKFAARKWHNCWGRAAPGVAACASETNLRS